MPTQPPKLLIVDDDRKMLASLQRALGRDFTVLTAADRTTAKHEAAKEPDLVLLDIRLNETDGSDRGGIDLLRELLLSNQVPIIMFSAYGDVETAVECMRLGAVDFVQKSAGLDELRQRLLATLDHARLSLRVTQLEERLGRLDSTDLIGESDSMKQVKGLIQMVAQDGFATVLIRGETGTGKELVARAIHRTGRRSPEPFVPVAIAALNYSLIESELFGHEPGAFTGARDRRRGYIEKAKRGILFLDEVGELTNDVQLKLLRFLEERRFARVGSSDEIEVDVQVIAATNRNLEQAVESGHFRADLYFRLNSVQIYLPPLRDRREDIPLLATHFLQMFRDQGRTRATGLSDEAAAALADYPWPGNVRELRAVLERAIIYSNYRGHKQLEKEDLPMDSLATLSSNARPARQVHLDNNGVQLDCELAAIELSFIEEALRATSERRTDAWKLLGLNDRFALRRRAQSLLKRYPSLASEFPTVKRIYGE